MNIQEQENGKVLQEAAERNYANLKREYPHDSPKLLLVRVERLMARWDLTYHHRVIAERLLDLIDPDHSIRRSRSSASSLESRSRRYVELLDTLLKYADIDKSSEHWPELAQLIADKFGPEIAAIAKDQRRRSSVVPGASRRCLTIG